MVHAIAAEEFLSGANGHRLQHRTRDLSCISRRHLSYRDEMLRYSRNHEVALLINPNRRSPEPTLDRCTISTLATRLGRNIYNDHRLSVTSGVIQLYSRVGRRLHAVCVSLRSGTKVSSQYVQYRNLSSRPLPEAKTHHISRILHIFQHCWMLTYAQEIASKSRATLIHFYSMCTMYHMHPAV